ncbi:MAG: hypothetical protein HYZ29_04725 [Myxococcales bacterium]|nr:hypothetical protein [Myxococcales bacterium]
MRLCATLGAWVLLLGCSASDGAGGSGGASGSAGQGAAASGGSGGGSGGGGSGAAPNGGGEIGDACSTNADCTAVPGSECFTTIGGGPVPTVTFPGGFCSKACDTQSTEKECGEKAGCASVGQSGGGMSTTLTLCSPPCANDGECRQAEGYKCMQIIPGIGVCAPP